MKVLHQNPKRNLFYLLALLLFLIIFFLVDTIALAVFLGRAAATFVDPLTQAILLVAMLAGLKLDALAVAIVSGAAYVLLNPNIQYAWVRGWFVCGCDVLLATTMANLAWNQLRRAAVKQP